MNEEIFVPTRSKYEQILEKKFEDVLERKLPKLIRAANRKEWLTTADFKDLFGVSYRLQKHYRDECGLPYSQEGKKIFYKTVDVEEFMADRRVNSK